MVEKETRSQFPLVLVGLPGAGKSRIGRALAGMLGLDHVDTDDVAARLAKKSIAAIFAEDGESAFRSLELEAVRQALNTSQVVSLGGGAIETAEVRELIKSGTVVHIAGDRAELIRRVSRSDRRPLLREDPKGQLARLAARRDPLYEGAADVTVRTSSGPARDVVNQILEAVFGFQVIRVNAAVPYPVVVGWECRQEALSLFEPLDHKAMVVTAPAVSATAERIREAFTRNGKETFLETLPEGEAAKTLETAERLWEAAGERRIGREDSIITVGGGATTDVGGFVAATWLRGIPVTHFPTTLLAMVDAAIGGKTGINSPIGKNLIGAFHNPRLVVADLSQLSTLPRREYTSGLAEVIKCGFISDTKILDLVAANPDIRNRDWGVTDGRDVLQELVMRAIRVKANVVAEDFREAGLRETLNYGHTLAHALEKESGYGMRHGEAVAIGMVLAAELAKARGMIGAQDVDAHRSLLAGLGLPVSARGETNKLVQLMQSDKKSRGGRLRFVLLTKMGEAETFLVDHLELEAAMQKVIES